MCLQAWKAECCHCEAARVVCRPAPLTVFTDCAAVAIRHLGPGLHGEWLLCNPSVFCRICTGLGWPAAAASAAAWAAGASMITLACVLHPCAPVQRRYSVAKIETSQTYEKGRPKLGGLSDPRMGTMDRAVKCTTDGASVLDCPGYFGHIELAKPMFHVHFIKTVVKVLRCVSHHNSKIMLMPVSAGWQAGRVGREEGHEAVREAKVPGVLMGQEFRLDARTVLLLPAGRLKAVWACRVAEVAKCWLSLGAWRLASAAT